MIERQEIDIERLMKLEELEMALNDLIFSSHQLKDQTINNMIEVREKIAEIKSLNPQEPKPAQVIADLKFCDGLLERGNNTLDKINARLSDYEEQKAMLLAEREKLQSATHPSSGPGF